MAIRAIWVIWASGYAGEEICDMAIRAIWVIWAFDS